MVDLSNYTAGYGFDEISSGAAALDINGGGVNDISSVNAIPQVAGMFDFARGPLKNVNNVAPAYFSEATLFSADWDIRGAVSCTVTLWFKLADLGGDHFLVSIHDPGSANGQAFLFTANDATAKCPRVFVMDGLSSFNGVQVTATGSTTPNILANVWQYVAFSYDTVLNLVRMFWGRAAGESYQNSAPGFAAGFGYDGVTGLTAGAGVHIGRYTGDTDPTMITAVDQLLWWKGQALTFQEMDLIWNNGDGVDFPGLANLGGDDGSAYNFYWGRRGR